MNRILSIFCLAVILLGPRLSNAQVQQILYSDPEREDGQRTNFEIIGKINGNFLIFKNNNSSNAISIYNTDMKLLNRAELSFMPERYINVDFIAYPDYFYIIYEYQHKNIVHISAVKLDGQCKKLGEPVELDTTQIGFAANNKIYTTIASEDKHRILVFKINSKNPKSYLFTMFLFDQDLGLIDRHRTGLPMEDKNELFSDFLVDNEGEMVFAKYERSGSNDYVSKVSVVTRPPMSDSFLIRDLGTGDRILDEIKIKVNNHSKQFILTGFYYQQRRGNIEGVYSVLWDKATNSKAGEKALPFPEDLRAVAKSSDASLKMAFNDFFIKHIVTERDGGFMLVSESLYTTSGASSFNRWDYYSPAYGGPVYGAGAYNPYYNPYGPYGRTNYGVSTRYHAENILVLNFDKNGGLEWSSVIPKSQFNDGSENTISTEMFNTGGEIHFLFNQYEKGVGTHTLLADQSVSPDGKVSRYPTLKNLDKGYQFMPRYGKQVSGWEAIVPCLYKNYLCFAKIDF
jgi:hypothetical protein